MADFESLRLRNSERHSKYLKLRTKYDDLKHEMHQMFKEQYIVNATNKEETFKKEERLLKMARKIVYAGSDNQNNLVTFSYRDKFNQMTKEKNVAMFSKSIGIMKPSFL